MENNTPHVAVGPSGQTLQVAQFSPVTLTAETLQILSKQQQNDKLIALYITYVEITTWQNNNSVKASSNFIAKRLGWKRNTVIRHKKTLINLGLIEDVRRTGEDGKVEGYYILVKHVVTSVPPRGDTGQEDTVAQGYTSANDLKISANDLKESTTDPEHKQLTNLYNLYLIRHFTDFDRLTHTGTDAERAAALDAAKKKYKFTPARQAKVMARLRDAGYQMTAQAIINVSKSSWHMGDNPNGKKYNDLATFICRSYEQVEKWANEEDRNE